MTTSYGKLFHSRTSTYIRHSLYMIQELLCDDYICSLVNYFSLSIDTIGHCEFRMYLAAHRCTISIYYVYCVVCKGTTLLKNTLVLGVPGFCMQLISELVWRFLRKPIYSVCPLRTESYGPVRFGASVTAKFQKF